MVEWIEEEIKTTRTTTVYKCDKCRKELDSYPKLGEDCESKYSVNLRIRLNGKTWRLSGEYCEECYESMCNQIILKLIDVGFKDCEAECPERIVWKGAVNV